MHALLLDHRFFLLLAWLLTIGFLSLPVFSAKPIYKYVDDAGTTNYTDRLESVPDRYRSRAQEVDPRKGPPNTSAPVTPESAPLAAPAGPDDNALAQVYQEKPSTGASWFDGFPTVAMPLPSRFQLGVGLASLVLIIGAVVVHGVSQNAVVKLMLKLAITLMLVGTFYMMYFSSLSERISEVTRDPAQGAIAGKELMGDKRGRK